MKLSLTIILMLFCWMQLTLATAKELNVENVGQCSDTIYIGERQVILNIPTFILSRVDNKPPYLFGYNALFNKRSLIKLNVVLPDTVYKWQKDILVMLKVTNTTPHNLIIRNPKYWGNTFPICKTQDGRVIGPKIRVWSGVVNYVMQLGAFETKNIAFGWTLNELFDFDYLPSGEYSISFVYCYGLPNRDKKGRVIDEQDVNSDVFTFYLKYD